MVGYMPHEISNPVGYLKSQEIERMLGASTPSIPSLRKARPVRLQPVHFPPRKKNEKKIQSRKILIIPKRRKLLNSTTVHPRKIRQDHNKSVSGVYTLELQDKMRKSNIVRDEINSTLEKDLKWIRDNMPVTLIRAQVFSKKWSAQKLHDMMRRMVRNQLLRGWRQWNLFNEFSKHSSEMVLFQKTNMALKCVHRFEKIILQRQRDAVNKWTIWKKIAVEMENESAAVQIQCEMRRFLNRDGIKFQKQYRAATCIQQQMRGKLARIFVLQYRITRLQEAAARLLQQAFRKKRGRNLMATLSNANAMNKAARCIQRMARNGPFRLEWMKRRQIQIEQTNAAHTIQKFIKSFLAKTLYLRMKRHKCARLLQLLWHSYKSWRRKKAFRFQQHVTIYLQQVHEEDACIIIQTRIRMHVARHCLASKKKYQRASHVLQRSWMRFHARKVANQRRAETKQQRLLKYLAAITIQRSLRSYAHRQMLKAVLAKTCIPLFMRALQHGSAFQTQFKDQIEHSAAVCLQSTYRKRCIRIAKAAKMLDRAVLKVQCLYRGRQDRLRYQLQLQVEQSLQLRRRCSATLLQNAYRARKSRLIVDSMNKAMFREKLAAAALRIQCAWRKRAGNFAVHLKKIALAQEAVRQENAISVLQRFFRRVVNNSVAEREVQGNLASILHLAETRKRHEFARHVAAKKLQRGWRAKGKKEKHRGFLLAHALAVKRAERKAKRQKVIDAYLIETRESREEEARLEKLLKK